jgi:hypothetical protein
MCQNEQCRHAWTCDCASCEPRRPSYPDVCHLCDEPIVDEPAASIHSGLARVNAHPSCCDRECDNGALVQVSIGEYRVPRLVYS